MSKLPDGKFGPSDVRLIDKQLHEARTIRDAERRGGHGSVQGKRGNRFIAAFGHVILELSDSENRANR